MSTLLLPAWLKISELLLRLGAIRQKRRREIFDEIFVPMEDELEKVHRNYMKLFRETLSALPQEVSVGRWKVKRNGETITLTNRKQVQDALSRLKRDFIESRDELVDIRIKMRARLDKFLEAPISRPEKRFVYGVVCYLLYPEDPMGTANSYIDGMIKFIVRKGSRNALRTPSSKLFAKIEPMTNPDYIYEAVQQFETKLRERWGEVSRLWAEAQLDVISSTASPK